ncbi:hypothetical protein DVH05_011807 [Phytophthora capsici]|nr:hypothetical protein DVH05_011807 [Phytophthora capsici]
MSDIHWYNAIPQYILVAASSRFRPTHKIAYTEIPMALRAVSVALELFMNSRGSTLLSMIVLLFGKDIPANLNDGHMENMYFTIVGIIAVNAIFYLIVMNKMQFAMIPRHGKEPTDNETDKDVQFELVGDRRSIN